MGRSTELEKVKALAEAVANIVALAEADEALSEKKAAFFACTEEEDLATCLDHHARQIAYRVYKMHQCKKKLEEADEIVRAHAKEEGIELKNGLVLNNR